MSHIGDNNGYKKNAELCNRNLNNKHMAKDAEIEQVLLLSKEMAEKKAEITLLSEERSWETSEEKKQRAHSV